jgi:hypothetical protein
MVFNRLLAADKKWRRKFIARFFALFPSAITAELIVTHFLLEDFDADYLDDYYHILQMLPKERWQASELAACLSHYFLSCDNITDKWLELLASTDWGKQPNFRLMRESLCDESFFLLFNLCQTVSRALYKEGYRRLSALKPPYSVHALIAVYRLNAMDEIYLDEQNLQAQVSCPVSITLLYPNRSSLCEPIVFFAQRPTIACITDPVQGVLLNHDNHIYPPSILLRRKACQALGRYPLSGEKLYQHLGLTRNFLDYLADNIGIMNWPDSASAVLRYLQSTFRATCQKIK